VSSATTTSFNPLFIRGKLQVRLFFPQKERPEYQSFNPLFIRGKLQVSTKAIGQMILNDIEKFQSLIHQGKIARSGLVCSLVWSVSGVSIPYSSGENCKRYRMVRHKGKWTIVSIPYSSGENCK